MKLIKWLINWLKKIFNLLFGKRKVTKKIKNNITNKYNKHYLKSLYGLNNGTLDTENPIYLLATFEDKKIIIQKLRVLQEDIQTMDIEEKQVTINKLAKIITKIEENDLTYYQKEKICEKLDLCIKDKEKSITKFNETIKTIDTIIEDININVYDKVIKEYKEINYLTLTTLIIDETLVEIEDLKNDLKHHKYNKNYYNRVLAKIKDRIDNLKKLHDSKDIQEEIIRLRKSIYYKNKDKYDLLYNNEVFANILIICDELLEKVNKRVIDIKAVKEKALPKEKQVEKQDNVENKEKTKKEEPKPLDENIIKRFQDMKLAYQLILINLKKPVKLNNVEELFYALNDSYLAFLNGEKAIFHFDRNKTKTELVKLYNDMQQIDCVLTKKEYVPLAHINYPLDELISAAINEKNALESNLVTKFKYQKEKDENSILVDNKLDILYNLELERKGEKPKVFVKYNNEKEN